MPRMQTDYNKLASQVFAITFPGTGRPPMLRSNYPQDRWKFYLDAADLNKHSSAHMVMDGSDEAKALMAELTDEMLDEETLMAMPDEMLDGRAMGLGLHFESGQSKRSRVLMTLSALEDKHNAEPIPQEPPKVRGKKAAASGE